MKTKTIVLVLAAVFFFVLFSGCTNNDAKKACEELKINVTPPSPMAGEEFTIIASGSDIQSFFGKGGKGTLSYTGPESDSMEISSNTVTLSLGMPGTYNFKLTAKVKKKDCTKEFSVIVGGDINGADTNTSGLLGNGICDEGENCFDNPDDCVCPNGSNCYADEKVCKWPDGVVVGAGNAGGSGGGGYSGGGCSGGGCSGGGCGGGTSKPYCGDGECNGSETCETCPVDCGECPQPPLPEILVERGEDQSAYFFDENAHVEAFFTWTLKNVGEGKAKINSIETLGCSDFKCSVLIDAASLPIEIEPNGQFELREKIDINTIPEQKSYPIKIKVIYEGEGTTSTMEKVSEESLLYVQGFEQEDICLTHDGKEGRTGPNNVPKVLFSWDWADIGLNECDKENSTDTEFIYCDPTQFSIELSRKLKNFIEEYENGASNEEMSDVNSFRVFLIADSYSEDFQKDFAYYYTHSFFEAPDWFDGGIAPISKYIGDPSRLQFSPRELPGSGAYNVGLSATFDDTDNKKFFDENSNPSAVITVIL